MTPMSRLCFTLAAVLSLGSLWAQTAVPQQAAPSVADQADSIPVRPSPASSGKAPKATKVVRPVYPFDGVKCKLQGKVVVRAVISESGDIESAEPVSGDLVLAQSAVDAAKQWKFMPYLKDGSPTKMAINVPFAFICIDSDSKNTQPLVTTNDSFWRDVPRELITVRASEGGTGNPGLILHRVEPTYPVIAKAS